jgi:ATP-binding cassette subfamily B protein
MRRNRDIYWSAWKNRLPALKNLPRVVALLWQSGRAAFAAEIILRLAAGFLPLAGLWVGKLIIDLIGNAAAGHAAATQGYTWMLLAAAFGIAALGNILGRATDYCDGRIADQFSREVGLRVMQHAATLDLASFEDPVFYDKVERARVQATDRAAMVTAFGHLVQQVITLVVLSTAVLVYSPLLFALLVLSVVPSFLGESHFAFLGYSLAYSLTPMKREMDYLRDLGTKKESAKELKVFGLGGFLQERYKSITDEINSRNRQLARRRLRTSSALAMLASFGYYFAYAILVYRALHGALSIGQVTFLAGSLAGCGTQLQTVFSTFTHIADQALFLTDLFDFLAMRPRICNAKNAIPAPKHIMDGIEFRNVSFSYPGSPRPVLKNVNLRIAAGERIALVGENGQGKTTLVKLLTRLYEPTSGQILLDGVDLRDIDIASLHERIGVIFQDFMRYDMPVRDNIAVGKTEYRNDEEKLIDAARKGGALDVVNRLEHGLDQQLGRRFQDGVDLSGGEWQRFALARAHIRDAEILVLDEPTAALDPVAEAEVFSKFSDLTRGKIALFISHRFSTVRMADRIVVLEGGVVREEGTHKDLIARRGRYADLFELQASSYR